jgi:hypothetical protein
VVAGGDVGHGPDDRHSRGGHLLRLVVPQQHHEPQIYSFPNCPRIVVVVERMKRTKSHLVVPRMTKDYYSGKRVMRRMMILAMAFWKEY